MLTSQQHRVSPPGVPLVTLLSLMLMVLLPAQVSTTVFSKLLAKPYTMSAESESFNCVYHCRGGKVNMCVSSKVVNGEEIKLCIVLQAAPAIVTPVYMTTRRQPYHVMRDAMLDTLK